MKRRANHSDSNLNSRAEIWVTIILLVQELRLLSP